MADLQKAPMTIETVACIDAIFAIEREINGRPPDERQTIRADRSRPLVTGLQKWLRANRARLSPKAKEGGRRRLHAQALAGLHPPIDNGRVCHSNNAAERAIWPIAVGRRNWIFAGSHAGGRRAVAMYTLIETTKLDGIDPRAWLADVLTRLRDYPANRSAELLSWNWLPPADQRAT